MFTFSAFFNKTLAISLALGLKFGKKDFEKYVMKTFTPINLLLITIITFTNLFAQQNERDRGIELYKKGNTVEAIQILEILSKNKEGKNDGEVWNYLGLAYLNESKNKDARSSFEKAIKLNPQSSAFHSNLAYAFLLERKVNKAQNVIKKALEINPQNANAYFIRGTADLWEGKFESAVADAEKSISVIGGLRSRTVSCSCRGVVGVDQGPARVHDDEADRHAVQHPRRLCIPLRQRVDSRTVQTDGGAAWCGRGCGHVVHP